MNCYIFFLTLLTALLSTFTLVVSTPVPTYDTVNDASHAYSGAGGSAPGGGVNFVPPNNDNLLVNLIGTTSLLKVGSDNAAHGGISNTGDVLGGASSASEHGRSTNGKPLPVNSNVNTDAFSGAGGQTPGGSVTNAQDGLISLGSNNAGAGGAASSGDSIGGLTHGIL